jgi:hypothetical protein
MLDEDNLTKTALPYFQTARTGDWEHALRVVQWIKELGQGRQDLHLLIVAGYLHDVGWSGIAPAGKIDLDEMLKLEPLANQNSPVMVGKILGSLHFSDIEIGIINRLVSAADKHRAEQPDEEIIVDADSLSKLCLEHLNEKYQPESFNKVIELWERELGERVKTAKGKELFPKLLKELKQKVAVPKP